MQLLAQTAERIAATTKKLEKTAIVAEYLLSRSLDDAAISAVFLSGRAFPAFEERTLQIGGSALWKLVTELAGARSLSRSQEKRIPRGLKSARDDKGKEKASYGAAEAAPLQNEATSGANQETTLRGGPAEALTAAYRRRGDLGSAAYDVLAAASTTPTHATLTLSEVQVAFEQIAQTRTATAKAAVLKSLLERATALEAKYLLKVITGELRIGLKESLVEEAIAKAYNEPLAHVQRVNMLLGDIGGTLRLAAGHRLDEARMRLFHPVGFMLASPAANADEAFQYFDHAQVEDKYDGIRAQAHCSSGQVRLFSRTLDEVTPSFPELVPTLGEFSEDVILDGEIVAWRHTDEGGHAMPFSGIQKRLGRKQVSPQLIKDVPVAYVVFDVIYGEGELTLDRPLHERAAILDRVFAGAKRVEPKPVVNSQGRLLFEPEVEAAVSGWVIRAPSMRADSPQQLEQLFDEAMARGNEGLMIKDISSSVYAGASRTLVAQVETRVGDARRGRDRRRIRPW